MSLTVMPLYHRFELKSNGSTFNAFDFDGRQSFMVSNYPGSIPPDAAFQALTMSLVAMLDGKLYPFAGSAVAIFRDDGLVWEKTVLPENDEPTATMLPIASESVGVNERGEPFEFLDNVISFPPESKLRIEVTGVGHIPIGAEIAVMVYGFMRTMEGR